ncbi:MAG: hypothetical protein AB1452_16430 [Pseudomonadota bacterium]
MGCLIQYAVRDGMLRAVVSGRAAGQGREIAAWIARDIAREAGRETCNRVLIDVRGVADRLGSLGALAMASGEPGRVAGFRVAVVDAIENDPYYALHEMAARARGYVLRCFTSVTDAVRWLRGVPGRD